MEISRCKAIILDFDGTIIKLGVNWRRVRRKLKDLFLSYGLEWHSLGVLLDEIRKSYQLLKRRYQESKKAEIFFRQAFNIIREEEIGAIKRAKLLPGTTVLLKCLEEKNIPVVIVSDNDSNCIEKCLEKFNLPRPAKIIGREMSNSHKPNKEPLLTVLRALKLKPKDCWYIGDSGCDLELGKQMKMKTFILSDCSAAIRRKKDNTFFISNLSVVKKLIKKVS